MGAQRLGFRITATKADLYSPVLIECNDDVIAAWIATKLEQELGFTTEFEEG